MRRSPHLLAFLCIPLLSSLCDSYAHAQIKSASDPSVLRYGDIQVTRYRVGASVTAKRGAVRDVLATVAVPLTCAEQEVTLVDEDITNNAVHDYRLLHGGGARQMLVRIPHLPNKAEAHAILTFEVRTKIILPPEETSQLTIPKKPPKDIKRYLGKSPFIETNHSKLKKLSRQIFADLEKSVADQAENADEVESTDAKSTDNPIVIEAPDQEEPSSKEPTGEEATASDTEVTEVEEARITDWRKVEAIYDHVQATIKYVEGDDKSALATLRDGEGDCQNISALFVGLCRTNKIPARIVWVHEHNYPEFCLADEAGDLHWFPCESSGMRAFGEMPTARVIMQKGDNFKVPERKKALRYASDYMIGLPAGPGGGPPSHRFIREKL